MSFHMRTSYCWMFGRERHSIRAYINDLISNYGFRWLLVFLCDIIINVINEIVQILKSIHFFCISKNNFLEMILLELKDGIVTSKYQVHTLFNNFVYSWLCWSSLLCRGFSSCRDQGLLCVVVLRLLLWWLPLLQSVGFRRLQAPRAQAPAAFSIRDWPVSPALAVGSFTEPQGSPQAHSFSMATLKTQTSDFLKPNFQSQGFSKSTPTAVLMMGN